MKKICILAVVTLLLAACQSPLLTNPTMTVAPEPPSSWVGQPLKGSLPDVYRVMEDGHLRHIADWPTYLSLGYAPESLQQVSDEILAGYELGHPITPWLTGVSDTNLYLLKDGRRHLIPNTEVLTALNGHVLDVSLVSDEFLANFATDTPLPETTRSDDQVALPRPTAVVWANGFLWIANETGLLMHWDVQTGAHKAYHLPDKSVIEAMAAENQSLYLGTNTGGLWQLELNGDPTVLVTSQIGWVSALASAEGALWYADVNHFADKSGYQIGKGLIRLASGEEIRFNLLDDKDAAQDPLKGITVMAFDLAANTLWAGTSFAGVLRYDNEAGAWQTFNTLNSALGNNQITDMILDSEGALWAATQNGVARYKDGTWENTSLAEGLTEKGAQSLAHAADNTIWVAGDHYVAYRRPGQSWLVYTALDHALLADQFQFVVMDDAGPWFIGRKRNLHFDGQIWTAYDSAMRRLAEFTPGQKVNTGSASLPVNFPNPLQDYESWLQTWPRPENDNGRGLHFLQTHWFDELETQKHINRMEKLGVRWTLVNYVDRYQLMRTAPMFKEAGIMVVWRPFVRPYQSYDHWAADIAFLQAQDIPPYIQLYNEPSLAQEWDESYPIDQSLFLNNLLPAVRQVYAAGGYVGLQFLDLDWLRITLQRMKAEGMSDVFDRLFFVPHPYGLNHPPEYDEDMNSVLGFQAFARVFEEEIGFIPMMVAGEGGWRPGEAQDGRYPTIDENLHCEYHAAVFDWFRTGQLSNREPLPDYFFAFCPWLISDPNDPAAWFDSSSGDRSLTIETIEAMPDFKRSFSWDR